MIIKDPHYFFETMLKAKKLIQDFDDDQRNKEKQPNTGYYKESHDLVYRLKHSLHKEAAQKCYMYFKKRLPDLDQTNDDSKSKKVTKIIADLLKTLEKCADPDILQFKKVIAKYDVVRRTAL